MPNDHLATKYYHSKGALYPSCLGAHCTIALCTCTMSPRSIERSIPRCCTVLVATLLLSLSLTPIIVECGITWNSPCLRATCTSNVPLIDVCTGDPINPKIFKSACYAYCNNQVRWRRCDGDIADDDDADATAPTIETRCTLRLLFVESAHLYRRL